MALDVKDMSCDITPEGYTELKSTAEVSNEEKTYVIPIGTIITVGAEFFLFSMLMFPIELDVAALLRSLVWGC